MVQPVKPIRAITFDLDDTLWDATPVLVNAEKQVYKWLEEYAPKVTDRFTIGCLAKWRWNEYKKSPQLANQISQLRISAMQQVMALVGYDKQLAAQMAKSSFEVFIHARQQVVLFDDVLPMLEKLKSQYILGTLTNGNADISKLPIAGIFQFSYSAEQLNSSKPSPELFIAAQQAAQCEAHEIVHVGDHLEHDVLGAHQAGCHALWYNPKALQPPINDLATMQVQSLAQIPKVINDFEATLSS